jgi:hypothetical protein
MEQQWALKYWPNPNQENAEIATTARDREVIMRIGRVAFTV